MLRPISPRKTPIGTPLIAEITSDLNGIRRHSLWGGIKEGGRKAMNMSKTSEVLQGPDESPSQVYECLCEVSHLCTCFDPEATENQWMINASFVGQAQGDIR
jgi:hypothetical protein